MSYKIIDKRTGKEYDFGINGKTKFKVFKTYGEASSALKAEGIQTVYTESHIKSINSVPLKHPVRRDTKEEALALREEMIKEAIKLLNLQHGMKFEIDNNDHWTTSKFRKGPVRQMVAFSDELKGEFTKYSYWPQFRVIVDLFEIFEIKEIR